MYMCAVGETWRLETLTVNIMTTTQLKSEATIRHLKRTVSWSIPSFHDTTVTRSNTNRPCRPPERRVWGSSCRIRRRRAVKRRWSAGWEGAGKGRRPRTGSPRGAGSRKQPGCPPDEAHRCRSNEQPEKERWPLAWDYKKMRNMTFLHDSRNKKKYGKDSAALTILHVSDKVYDGNKKINYQDFH